MPPKGNKKGGKGGKDGKKKKLSVEEEAKLRAEAVDDIDDAEYKKSVREECR
jgi:hypothetical protein